jgi:hypothetical protein
MAEPVVRLTVNLTPEVAEALAKLADSLGTNKTTALHKAILTTELLATKEEEGSVVQVKNDEKQTVQQMRVGASQGRPPKRATPGSPTVKSSV